MDTVSYSLDTTVSVHTAQEVFFMPIFPFLSCFLYLLVLYVMAKFRTVTGPVQECN